MRYLVLLLVFTAAGEPGAAQSLLCFGNEPSWSIDFSVPSRARVTAPGKKPLNFQGTETRNEPLHERLWRGKASSTGGDLVVFLRDAACSDGMSDVTHPVTVRASMPGGEFLVGCCRIAGGKSGAMALEGTTWRLVDFPGHDIATLSRGLTTRFESGRVSGSGGCNRYTGTYTLQENRVTFGHLAGTRMACPGPAMSIEREFLKALTGTSVYAVTDDRLTLTADSGAVLEFKKDSAP